MAKGIEKRKRIFNKYINQLKTLNDNKLLPETVIFKENTYLCPICLGEFTEVDLNPESQNMLTLEDAPPQSLGGHANTLTCKSCNSTCGHEIDFHLNKRLVELDERAFLPNAISKVKLIHKGTQVQGDVKVDSKGEITVIVSGENNHPEKFKNYVNTTGKDDIVDIEFKQSRVDKHRLEVALLKSAYMLAFEQYGYALILNSSFNIVRSQLMNPGQEIYPEGFWTKQNVFKEEHEGVHLIKSEGFDGFYSIFKLKTQSSVKRYGVYLPIAEHLTHPVIEKLSMQESGFALKFDSLKVNDYFGNTKNMSLMANFLRKKNIT